MLMGRKIMEKIEIPLEEWDILHPGLAVYLISTVSKEGILNIAPYGMVMPISYQPLIYALSSTRDRDTYHNIKVTIEERSIIFGDVVSLSLNQNLHLKKFSKQKKMLNPIFYCHGSYFKLGKYVGDRKK